MISLQMTKRQAVNKKYLYLKNKMMRHLRDMSSKAKFGKLSPSPRDVLL